jgi:hypothetical protein
MGYVVGYNVGYDVATELAIFPTTLAEDACASASASPEP